MRTEQNKHDHGKRHELRSCEVNRHMKFGTPVSSNDMLREPRDFSLVPGGPLFQRRRRVRLSDDAVMLLRRRIIVISLSRYTLHEHCEPRRR
jgi:hypothetical protein